MEQDDALALYKAANKDIVDIIEKFNLKSKTRQRGIVYKRYYLYHVLTSKRFFTREMAGKFFGKDHSTVVHGLKLHDYWWKVKDMNYLTEINPVYESLKNEKIDDGLYGFAVEHLGEEETKVIISGRFDWRVLEKLPSRMSKEELIKIFKKHGKNERGIHADIACE